MKTADRPNWEFLAVMRFALATIVVCTHMGFISGKNPLDAAHVVGGFSAVLAFFIVSGFSISHSINREPKGYLRRRFWRIYPTFLFCIMAGTLPFAFKGVFFEIPNASYMAPEPMQFLLNCVPIQAVFVAAIPTVGVLWSLGIEEFFYCCAPLFRKLSGAIIWGIIIFSACCFSFGQPWGFSNYPDGASLLKPLGLAWAWLLGWILYQNMGNAKVTVIALLITLVCICSNKTYHATHSAPLLAASVILISHMVPVSIPERFKPFANWLGDMSYPMYVLHFPVFIWGYLFFKITAWPLVFLLILLVSAAVLHGIDRPLRKRGRPQGKALEALPSRIEYISAIT